MAALRCLEGRSARLAFRGMSGSRLRRRLFQRVADSPGAVSERGRADLAPPSNDSAKAAAFSGKAGGGLFSARREGVLPWNAAAFEAKKTYASSPAALPSPPPRPHERDSLSQDRSRSDLRSPRTPPLAGPPPDNSEKRDSRRKLRSFSPRVKSFRTLKHTAAPPATAVARGVPTARAEASAQKASLCDCLFVGLRKTKLPRCASRPPPRVRLQGRLACNLARGAILLQI